MLVIDSQTGLRASELSLLEANSIEEVDIDGKIAKMIKYKIVKSVRGGNNEYINAITYINDISFEAYKVATEVFQKAERTATLIIFVVFLKPNYQYTQSHTLIS